MPNRSLSCVEQDGPLSTLLGSIVFKGTGVSTFKGTGASEFNGIGASELKGTTASEFKGTASIGIPGSLLVAIPPTSSSLQELDWMDFSRDKRTIFLTLERWLLKKSRTYQPANTEYKRPKNNQL